MSRAQAIDRLMRGVGEDVREYRELVVLLDEQFDAALHHDAARTAELGQRITAAVDRLDTRRLKRIEIVRGLLGDDARMDGVIAMLPPPRKALLAEGWRALEGLVRICKERNTRNRQLMTDQQAVMQHVLHGETQTYAPA